MNANERKMEESNLNALEIIAKIFRGDLPADLEVKTQFIAALLDFEHSISSSHALLITVARRDNFKDDKVWASWCEDRFGFTASYRCHMVQAGRLLLDVIKKIDVFQFLFKLELYKLISIERIDRLKLENFLKANDVANLNRDQVRDAVNNFLGEEHPEHKKFPAKDAHQPDLFDLVGSICILRPEAVIKSITDTQKADQACDSGLLLYASSLEFYKANPGTLSPEKVQAFIEALEDDLKTLNAIGRGFNIKKVM